MSRTKLNYVYDCFDSIIDLIESETNKNIILEKITSYRDELPTEKEVLQELIDNMDEKI